MNAEVKPAKRTLQEKVMKPSYISEHRALCWFGISPDSKSIISDLDRDEVVMIVADVEGFVDRSDKSWMEEKLTELGWKILRGEVRFREMGKNV